MADPRKEAGDTSDDLMDYVPEHFRKYFNNKREDSVNHISLNYKDGTLKFDEFGIQIKKGDDGYSFEYTKFFNDTDETKPGGTTLTDYPEYYIYDLLSWMLKNPEDRFSMEIRGVTGDDCLLKLDKKGLNAGLKTLFDKLFHKPAIRSIHFEHLDEDTFIAIMKKSKPGALQAITLNIEWKDPQNLKFIVQEEPWKQAASIFSLGIAPLGLNDVKHCRESMLHRKIVTPEFIEQVKDFFSKTEDRKTFTIRVENGDMRRDEIKNVLKKDSVRPRHDRIISDNKSIEYCYGHPAKLYYMVTLTASTVKFDNNNF